MNSNVIILVYLATILVAIFAQANAEIESTGNAAVESSVRVKAPLLRTRKTKVSTSAWQQTPSQ
jgi:hypothetical protein